MPLTSVIFSLTRAPGADEEWIAKMSLTSLSLSLTARTRTRSALTLISRTSAPKRMVQVADWSELELRLVCYSPYHSNWASTGSRPITFSPDYGFAGSPDFRITSPATDR